MYSTVDILAGSARNRRCRNPLNCWKPLRAIQTTA
nr:MAG TPA: hypothetical protein [Caudoviricetes sp.]